MLVFGIAKPFLFFRVADERQFKERHRAIRVTKDVQPHFFVHVAVRPIAADGKLGERVAHLRHEECGKSVASRPAARCPDFDAVSALVK
nr:MAG TPA: hypothetical protein [Caudoviricetes sp.]